LSHRLLLPSSAPSRRFLTRCLLILLSLCPAHLLVLSRFTSSRLSRLASPRPEIWFVSFPSSLVAPLVVPWSDPIVFTAHRRPNQRPEWLKSAEGSRRRCCLWKVRASSSWTTLYLLSPRTRCSLSRLSCFSSLVSGVISHVVSCLFVSHLVLS
jgi:hypothetical protein